MDRCVRVCTNFSHFIDFERSGEVLNKNELIGRDITKNIK